MYARSAATDVTAVTGGEQPDIALSYLPSVFPPAELEPHLLGDNTQLLVDGGRSQLQDDIEGRSLSVALVAADSWPPPAAAAVGTSPPPSSSQLIRYLRAQVQVQASPPVEDWLAGVVDSGRLRRWAANYQKTVLSYYSVRLALVDKRSAGNAVVLTVASGYGPSAVAQIAGVFLPATNTLEVWSVHGAWSNETYFGAALGALLRDTQAIEQSYVESGRHALFDAPALFPHSSATVGLDLFGRNVGTAYVTVLDCGGEEAATRYSFLRPNIVVFRPVDLRQQTDDDNDGDDDVFVPYNVEVDGPLPAGSHRHHHGSSIEEQIVHIVQRYIVHYYAHKHPRAFLASHTHTQFANPLSVLPEPGDGQQTQLMLLYRTLGEALRTTTNLLFSGDMRFMSTHKNAAVPSRGVHVAPMEAGASTAYSLERGEARFAVADVLHADFIPKHLVRQYAEALLADTTSAYVDRAHRLLNARLQLAAWGQAQGTNLPPLDVVDTAIDSVLGVSGGGGGVDSLAFYTGVLGALSKWAAQAADAAPPFEDYLDSIFDADLLDSDDAYNDIRRRVVLADISRALCNSYVSRLRATVAQNAQVTPNAIRKALDLAEPYTPHKRQQLIRRAAEPFYGEAPSRAQSETAAAVGAALSRKTLT